MAAPMKSTEQSAAHGAALKSGRTSPYLRAVGLSSVAKIITLGFSGAATLASTRVTVDALGVSGYALVALVSTLPGLLAVTGLGTTAAVIDALSSGDRERVRCTLGSGARALIYVGAAIASAGAVAAASGAATPLLGSAATRDAASCFAVVTLLFGCSLPLSMGGAALTGLGRNHFAVLLQGGGSVLALIVAVLAALCHAPTAVFAASGLVGQCASGLMSLVVAGRILRMPLLRIVAFPRHIPGTRIIHLAGPMAVINMTSAVAYGTDRLVLSNVTDANAVAVYSAGAQLYAPTSALLATSALPLWGLFGQRRRISETPPRGVLLRLTAAFTCGALAAGALLVAVGPMVADWMLHGRAFVDRGLMAAFAALLLAHAVNYPAGMWLSDAAGLRFQAVRAAVMTVVNLAASVPLALAVGPAGPVLASAGAHFLCVTLPCHQRVYITRRR